MIRTKRFAAAVLGLLLVAACQNDKLNRPFNVTPVDPLFDRYVSMGNSITAGFQSGGINDSTQSQSYAVLLARAMHTPFFSPLMNKPGCPPPYTNVFTGARFGGGTPTTCALRKTQAVTPPFISNTAVPGALVNDIYTNGAGAHANSLTQFFLGGLTQVQMAAKADPTFVSIWIGNNDVLGAATSFANAGDTTLITPTPLFQARYDSLVASLNASTSARGGILVGVANVTRIPYFSRGSTYFAIKAGAVPGAAFPPNFVVTPNCAPPRGDSVLVPFPYGLPKIDSAAGIPAGTFTLDCSVPQVVVPEELVQLVAAVTAYNAKISAVATAQGWAYFDPNPVFDSIALAGSIPAFPFAKRFDTGAINSCAGAPAKTTPPPAPATPPPFGLIFSCDGVHPSAAAHRLIAQHLRSAINTEYTTAIPAIP